MEGIIGWMQVHTTVPKDLSILGFGVCGESGTNSLWMPRENSIGFTSGDSVVGKSASKHWSYPQYCKMLEPLEHKVNRLSKYTGSSSWGCPHWTNMSSTYVMWDETASLHLSQSCHWGHDSGKMLYPGFFSQKSPSSVLFSSTVPYRTAIRYIFHTWLNILQPDLQKVYTEHLKF